MPEIAEIRLGDLVQMRKPHACGENEWTIVRTGIDIRIQCRRCGRSVLMARPQFLRSAKRISRPAPRDEAES